MSESNERPSIRAGYVAAVIFFALGLTILQYTIAAGVYWCRYGVPTYRDATTIWVPEYSHAELWKGNVVFAARVTSGGFAPNTGVLMSFDPESGKSVEIDVGFGFPIAGLVADGDRLWTVGMNSLTVTEGTQSQQFTTRKTLVRPGRPFLYEGRIATIDMGTRGPPKLFVFRDDDWTDQGIVVIPFDFKVEVVDGKKRLVRTATSTGSTGGASLSAIDVLSYDGQLHLFVSNGSDVVYRSGIELAPTSALLPANQETHIDLSELDDWEIACPAPSNLLMRGKPAWRVGLVNGEPVVVTSASSSNTNPFQPSQVICFRRSGSQWIKSDEISSSSMMELLTVTDGTVTYVAPYSLMGGLLRVRKVDESGLTATGAVFKAPEPGFLKIELRALRLMQWVYWPGLGIFILGLSYLINSRGTPDYQFGNSTVELASFSRRGFARVVDYFLYVAAGYLVAYSFGMASQEEAEKNADRFFDFGKGGLMMVYMWMMLTFVVSYLIILLVTSWIEGRWGLTLGKWIFGIRTRRCTLRPCGLLRALLREIATLIDTIFAICCLPGSLCIAFTANRQRIGDLIADTIVIRKPKPLQDDSQTTT